ncbi:hypothetical protein IPG36_07330 [bacterium]|nr:MAG: hypothetical protein IPG36_07330 [bacterium]
MPESYMARKPAVVIVTCSDQRRNDALKAFTDELEKQGYTTYTVRQPGGALQYARAFWFVVALQLRVFLKKGALYLYLENHPDCAGLAYLRDSVRERHSLRQRGIEDETSHHPCMSCSGLPNVCTAQPGSTDTILRLPFSSLMARTLPSSLTGMALFPRGQLSWIGNP